MNSLVWIGAAIIAIALILFVLRKIKGLVLAILILIGAIGISSGFIQLPDFIMRLAGQ